MHAYAASVVVLLSVLEGRRQVVSRAVLASSACIGLPHETRALSPPTGRARRPPGVVSIPLTDCGGSYCTVFRVDGNPFRAVVDTGSPFITVAGSCTRRWGCYSGQGAPSGLADTFERFAGREGGVQWRRGSVGLGERGKAWQEDMTFGVLSDELVGRPGGVFLGLVKREAEGIRPTFLSQTPFQSFRIDLRRRDAPRLDMSAAPLVPADADALPLVDLRPFGSPVEHYATRVSAVRVNGAPLEPADGKPVYAIWDSGTTGLAMSCGLWDAALAKYVGGAPAPWTGTVDVELPTARRGRALVSADRPTPTTPIGALPWPGFDGHLLVLGLSFLEGRALTVDCDRSRLWLGYGGPRRVVDAASSTVPGMRGPMTRPL